MITVFRGLAIVCLVTSLCACAAQRGSEQRAVAPSPHSPYVVFAGQLGGQTEGAVASFERTPLGGPAEIVVGLPYTSGLRMLCRRATVKELHREITVAVCRQPAGEWTLTEPIFEPLPR